MEDLAMNEHTEPDEGVINYPIKLTAWVEDEDRRLKLIYKLRNLLVEYGANYRLKENCLWENRVYKNR
jgi:hypothetical protein